MCVAFKDFRSLPIIISGSVLQVCESFNTIQYITIKPNLIYNKHLNLNILQNLLVVIEWQPVYFLLYKNFQSRSITIMIYFYTFCRMGLFGKDSTQTVGFLSNRRHCSEKYYINIKQF